MSDLQSHTGTLFPVFLKLQGRRVLLVGGGPVAAGKLPALLAASAAVTVVAPEVRPEIERSGVTILRRPFVPSDLDGVWFVVAAATPDVNLEVSRNAELRHVFVNAVDDPRSASAYTGGVLRRGGVTVSVSTEGAAPALAGLLREGLEAVLPEDLDRWVDVGREARRGWKESGRTGGPIPFTERRPLLLHALNGLYQGRAS